MTATATGTRHAIRFPNETAAYRHARDELLAAEIALRRQTEAVAALRRSLPPGGAVPEDYRFDEACDPDDLAATRPVHLSELFVRPDAPLVLYSFMYGPRMPAACPSCTSILDSLDRTARHATQRINLAAVAKSPPPRLRAHARERGWRTLRLLSSSGNTYNRDYHGETASGAQMPALNVFVRRDGVVRHVYCTELLFAPPEPGQDPRHADAIWPLWNLLDFTPEGRGTDFHPALRYPDEA
jgi:predicted dithiol-disulfide oxidoreductase (DUF899 family)